MTAVKSLFFLILVPGIFIVYIPQQFLLDGPLLETGVLAYLAYPLWIIGGFVIFWCFWDFLSKGKGTPAPFDPPKELVVAGLYRYVRNPMYVGVLLTLLGNFLWYKTLWMVVYMVFFFLAFHLFVLIYEEPTLKRMFGASYEAYLNKVPRWIPKLTQKQ